MSADRAREYDEQRVYQHPEVPVRLALPILADGQVVEPVPEEQDCQECGGVERYVDADEAVDVTAVRPGASLVDVGCRQRGDASKAIFSYGSKLRRFPFTTRSYYTCDRLGPGGES